MISPDQITAWATAGESETLEFKRTTGQRREAAWTLCAMLNHRGGRVLFGVEPDGRVVGQSGTLHFGLTPVALFEPHESLPWNPLIASVFYRRGIIETWGRGTLKMAELTQRLRGIWRRKLICGGLRMKAAERYVAKQG